MNSDNGSFFLEAIKSILNFIWQLLKDGTTNFLNTFQNYNLIDFLGYFYIGYILGVLLGKIFGLLGGRYGWGYLIFAFFYYIIFVDCFIVSKHPIAFGIGTSFTILTIMNILQKPYGINYKEVALIFPMFKYFGFASEIKIPTLKSKQEPDYNQQKLDEFFDKIDTWNREFEIKEQRKREKKEKIENKINEIIKKLEDF
jgi:hypothetical protein